MSCEYGEKLILYFYGEAGGALGADVRAHLEGCSACREELAALKGVSGFLASQPGPRQSVIDSVMRAARAAAVRHAGFVFTWREALLSGALASVLAGVFALSGQPAGKELAWNSGLDSRLDSVEYSVYQEQSEQSAYSGDWDYRYSGLEDESISISENA
jgi:predicted anti-sigma-YlaC factor YlaD